MCLHEHLQFESGVWGQTWGLHYYPSYDSKTHRIVLRTVSADGVSGTVWKSIGPIDHLLLLPHPILSASAILPLVSIIFANYQVHYFTSLRIRARCCLIICRNGSMILVVDPDDKKVTLELGCQSHWSVPSDITLPSIDHWIPSTGFDGIAQLWYPRNAGQCGPID